VTLSASKECFLICLDVQTEDVNLVLI